MLNKGHISKSSKWLLKLKYGYILQNIIILLQDEVTTEIQNTGKQVNNALVIQGNCRDLKKYCKWLKIINWGNVKAEFYCTLFHFSWWPHRWKQEWLKCVHRGNLKHITVTSEYSCCLVDRKQQRHPKLNLWNMALLHHFWQIRSKWQLIILR